MTPPLSKEEKERVCREGEAACHRGDWHNPYDRRREKTEHDLWQHGYEFADMERRHELEGEDDGD